MSKNNMDALEAEFQELVKGAEELNFNILSIHATNESGNKTTASGCASAAQVSDEMKAIMNGLEDFQATLDGEIEKLGNKENAIKNLDDTKMETMKLQLSLKESLSKCYELDEIISKEKDEKGEDEKEMSELEGKIAAKIKEMEEENLEYQKKANDIEAKKRAIEDELVKKKSLLEAELANPQQNYFFEGGDQSFS
uniref:Uncharacterized protein n=1 Tax=Panagrolaimus sp. PS1159 TaxID=55785 RepID=A0AC35GQ04_9BILA